MPLIMYKMGFEDLDPGQCRATHVQPFSADLHCSVSNASSQVVAAVWC